MKAAAALLVTQEKINRRRRLTEWAKNSKCFAMWNRFWSQTDLDEKFWSLQPKAETLREPEIAGYRRSSHLWQLY